MKKNKEVIELCQNLVQNENYEYAQLPLSAELPKDNSALYYQQVNLPFLLEIVTTGGFFLYQVFYTCSIYLLLPERIAISWSGFTVVQTQPRIYIFAYVIITALLLIGLRSNLFLFYFKTFLFHRDYIRALVSNLFIASYLSIQHYIVYSTLGFSMSKDLFLFLWILIQSSLWIVGTLIMMQWIRKYRRKEGKKE